MDGYDVSTVAVKGARNVQWLAVHVGHEQGFGVGSVVRILFYDIARGHHML